MRSRFFNFLMLVTMVGFVGLMGCGGRGSPTVTPADAEKVPADAPAGEEKPSTDEQ